MLLSFLNSDMIANIYLLMVLKSLMPVLIASTLLFGVADHVSEKAKLYTIVNNNLMDCEIIIDSNRPQSDNNTGK